MNNYLADYDMELFVDKMSTVPLHELLCSTSKSPQRTPNLNNDSKNVLLHTGKILVRRNCTLRIFSLLVPQINDKLVLKSQSPYTDNVHFVPSLRLVLSNAMGKSKLDTLLDYFAEVANILEVKEDD